MLIKCCSTMFSIKHFKTFCEMFLKHNIFSQHFKNVFKMCITNVFENPK